MKNINLLTFNENIAIDVRNFTFLKDEPHNEIRVIPEIQMHKLLYFQFGLFYEKFKKELFLPNFQAWKYGPVEMDYRQNYYDKFKDIILDDEEETYLQLITKNILNLSIDDLINLSHETIPWQKNYVGSYGNSMADIPTSDIKSYFINVPNPWLQVLKKITT